MNEVQIHRHSCLVTKSEDFNEIGTEISFKIYLYDLQESEQDVLCLEQEYCLQAPSHRGV